MFADPLGLSRLSCAPVADLLFIDGGPSLCLLTVQRPVVSTRLLRLDRGTAVAGWN